MVRSKTALCLVSLTLSYHRPALPDFRLTAAAPQLAGSDEPHISPGDPGNYLAKSTSKRQTISIIHIIEQKTRADVRAGTVQGFGAAVPLAFACLQIVPKSVNVVYGPNVDPQTPVNWSGGQSWAAVLREALRPVGLSLVPHGDVVEITN